MIFMACSRAVNPDKYKAMPLLQAFMFGREPLKTVFSSIYAEKSTFSRLTFQPAHV